MRNLLALIFTLALAAVAHAAELGDDGLHKAPWMKDTFKDLAEDHAEAMADGKRLLIMIEQRGCIYCAKMHEEVFPQEEITRSLEEDFFVVQINMFGDVEVTDFDGTTLPEKDMVRRWRAMFTPTLMFFGPETPDVMASEAAVATMPGAFGVGTTKHLFEYVLQDLYDSEESFQAFHARRVEEDAAN